MSVVSIEYTDRGGFYVLSVSVHNMLIAYVTVHFTPDHYYTSDTSRLKAFVLYRTAVACGVPDDDAGLKVIGALARDEPWEGRTFVDRNET